MASIGPASPRITGLAWGRIEISDGRTFRDAKLWPGGGREWDWSETGTRHVPGIQPADTAELIDNGCSSIVLTRGMLLRLRTCAETLRRLEEAGIAVHVEETRKAASLYNELAARGDAVGGLFHSTC